MKKYLTEERKERLLESLKIAFEFGILFPAIIFGALGGLVALVIFLITNNLAWTLLFTPFIIIFATHYNDD